MSDVLLLGEPMAMFYANEYGELDEVSNFQKGVAGAEVNVGIGLSRLGFSVEYFTKLGRDPFGKYIYNYLENENIDVRHITFDDAHQTGIMLKNKILNGDPKTIYYRKGSAASALSTSDIENLDFSRYKLIHVTGILPALSKSTNEACLSLVEKAKAAGCFITFDPNLRPSLWDNQAQMVQSLNHIASFANIVLPGINEGEILTGSRDLDDIADFYLNRGSDAVIIKNGNEGAYLATQDGRTKAVPGFKVEEVVDTVGAGDGFAVGVISGLLDGISLEEAVIRGNAIGSIQVQHPGDNEGLPYRNELYEYIENRYVLE